MGGELLRKGWENHRCGGKGFYSILNAGAADFVELAGDQRVEVFATELALSKAVNKR